MITQKDIDMAIDKLSLEMKMSTDEAREAIAIFIKSIAIDEDKAVEEMFGCASKSTAAGEDYETRYMKAALHASPHYKLVKMMGEGLIPQ